MKEAEKAAKTPYELRQIKILRLLLRTIAAWPGRELGEKVWKVTDFYIYYLLVQALSAVVPILFYIILNVKKLPFVILGDRCVSLVLTGTGAVRLTCGFRIRMLTNVTDTDLADRHPMPDTLGSKLKMILLTLRNDFRMIGKIFFTKMHLIYFKNKSEYAMKVYCQVHKLSEWCTIYLVTSVAGALIFFNVVPILMNYSEGIYSEGIHENSSKVYFHAAYYSFPFKCDYLTNFKSYVFVSLFSCHISYFTGIYISILDLYLFIIVFHIWGHYKILIHDLKTIPKPMSLDKYTAQESYEVNEKLKECIKYHNLITEFTKMLSEAFGPTLLMYTGFMLFSTCILLLECAYQKEALMRFGPITIVIFLDIIQFGLVFELIGTAGDDLKNLVYDVPWEFMDSNNRFIVLFMLMNVQKPVRVKALGMTEMGIATVASILKTSFSFFTFMRTID